uniref:Thylakoid lumenal 25.6 kDa protein, chloroplast n=1 Tax=Solanum tuberosum TaxID=4113 RepID=M1CA02_SOLTU
MVLVQNYITPCQAYLPNASSSQVDVMHQLGWFRSGHNRRAPGCVIRSENVTETSTSSCQVAAENKKGFLPVTDNKDGYSFLYPFGWQEVVVEGEDKVFKDVIEPLESASVNLVPSSKEDIRDFGSPQQVAETLIKKFLASPSQKTKLIEASERIVDGKTYYTFEFVAQAPNYTRHALTVVCIGNGKFYTLTTGANERRWGKMKDRLHTVVDSFQIFNV